MNKALIDMKFLALILAMLHATALLQAGVIVELRNGKVEEAESVEVEGNYLVLKQKGKTVRIYQSRLKDSEKEKFFPAANKKPLTPQEPTKKTPKEIQKIKDDKSPEEEKTPPENKPIPAYDTNVFTLSEESDDLFLKEGILVESDAYSRGVPMEASKCAEMLATISGAKTYRTDGTWKSPDKAESALASKNKAELKSEELTIQQMYYFADKRERMAFLEALAKEMPAILANKNPSETFRRAFEIARSVAPEMCVELAGAAVLTCDPKQLAASLAQLADAHGMIGDRNKAETILNQPDKHKMLVGENWLSGIRYEVSQGDGPTDMIAQFHQSVLTGSTKKAESILNKMRELITIPEDKKQKTKATFDKKTLGAFAGKLARVKGEIVSGLSEADMENMKVAMSAAIIAGNSELGYSDRLRNLSAEKLLAMVDQLCDIYGRQSDQMVDLILYLIEERGYSGTDISVDKMLWGAIHAKSRYNKIRAIPMFMLAQKVGMGKRGTSPSQHALSDQFAVEAGIYIIQSMDLKESLVVEMAPVWERAIWNSVELANKKETHGRAKAYNYMATAYLTNFYNNIHDSAKLRAAYIYLAENSLSLQVQAEATLDLSRILVREKDYASALKEAEKVASGQTQWRAVSSSIKLIQHIAKKTNDVKTWNKSKEYAQKALAHFKDDPETVETLKVLIQNKHEFS